MTRRLLDYGTEAVLVECADLAETLGLLAALDARPLGAVDEVVPGARTLLLRLGRPLSGAEHADLLTRDPVEADPAETPEMEIEVSYDGPDLGEVAEMLGLSVPEVVRAHTGQTWTVGFCGFAPGFAYLQGETDVLRVPRRTSPRTRVPAGAVGLADVWSGIYPRTGPGGWQLIGRTTATVWDPDREPPALLRPGSRVRFVDRGSP